MFKRFADKRHHPPGLREEERSPHSLKCPALWSQLDKVVRFSFSRRSEDLLSLQQNMSVNPCSQIRHRSLNSDLERVISIGGILFDAIPLERIILAILVANVMSEHQTGPRCRRIPHRKTYARFQAAILLYYTPTMP